MIQDGYGRRATSLRLGRLGLGASCSAGIGLLMLPGLALAQIGETGAARAGSSETVVVPTVSRMYVSSLGATYSQSEWNLNHAPGAPGNPVPESCTGLSAHTDKNFQPGTYTLQLGFAQGELQAATYTLPPDHFPLRLDTLETFWATTNAVGRR